MTNYMSPDFYELRADDMAELSQCENCGEYNDEFDMCPNGCDFRDEPYTVFPTNLGDIPCMFDDPDTSNETEFVEFKKDGYVPTDRDMMEMGLIFSEMTANWAEEQDAQIG